jgi:hypothetical protein
VIRRVLRRHFHGGVTAVTDVNAEFTQLGNIEHRPGAVGAISVDDGDIVMRSWSYIKKVHVGTLPV